MTFRLLALDGGGIRGYMTAQIMARLEEETGLDLTSKDTVDGYAGTSTGGLLAITLANGNTPATMASVYRDRAPEIFRSNHNRRVAWAIDQAARFVPGLRDLISGFGIFSSQYVATGLRALGEELIGDVKFEDFDADRVLAVNTAAMKIPDASVKEGWTSTTMCNHWLPKSRIGDSRQISQLDAALATSAAPGYFPPHEVTRDGTSLGFFADGGLFANNPVLNGMTVAMAADRAALEDFSVISIGTGVDATGIPSSAFRSPRAFGILAWFGLAPRVPTGALLSITLGTSADNMTWLAGNLLADHQIVRLNPVLSRTVALDGITRSDFAVMDQAVEELVKTQRWTDAVNALKSWGGQ